MLPSGEFDPSSTRRMQPTLHKRCRCSHAHQLDPLRLLRSSTPNCEHSTPTCLYYQCRRWTRRWRRLWPQRLFGSMFAIFASIAMLLATCGLYAVTSYAVSAARARSACVSRSAPTHARCGGPSRARHRQLSIGVVIGTAGAAAIAAVLLAFLVGSGGGNYLVLAGVVTLLVAAGITASTVPARRAMRLDPTAALQSE